MFEPLGNFSADRAIGVFGISEPPRADANLKTVRYNCANGDLGSDW